jgi:hypothetical protein
MNVEMKMKNWNVALDDNKKEKLVGEYGIFLEGKEIASKRFNDGYGSDNLSFSHELKMKIKELGVEVTKEIQALLT